MLANSTTATAAAAAGFQHRTDTSAAADPLWSREGVRDAVLLHLLETLEATPQEDEPYSHFYLKQPFPAEMYPRLLQRLPEPRFYRPLSPRKYVREDGVSTRDVLELNEQTLSPLSPEKQAFWLGVADALTSSELKDQVFEKLGTDLSQRFRLPVERLSEVVAYPKPALIRDVGGYHIAPHPDVKKKIVTMQFYLPSDESQVDLGTAVYKRRKTLPAMLSAKRRFEKVKQFAFLPNSGYGFAVSNHSWHGRELVPEALGVRNSLLLIYYNRPDKGY